MRSNQTNEMSSHTSIRTQSVFVVRTMMGLFSYTVPVADELFEHFVILIGFVFLCLFP